MVPAVSNGRNASVVSFLTVEPKIISELQVEIRSLDMEQLERGGRAICSPQMPGRGGIREVSMPTISLMADTMQSQISVRSFLDCDMLATALAPLQQPLEGESIKFVR
ncbi:unnamed protein product [Camellia sinensis]